MAAPGTPRAARRLEPAPRGPYICPMSTNLRRRPAVAGSRPSLRFSGINLALLVAGLLSLAVGYYLLANASHTVAPLLLAVGYVVLLPLAIIL
jgi:hypothetical protein